MEQRKHGSIHVAAFIATLWVKPANLIYLPIADKLKVKHQHEALYLEIISEGVISSPAETIPGTRMKLLSFLLPDKRPAEDA